MGGVAKAVSGTIGSVKKVISNPGKANFGDFATVGTLGAAGPLNAIGMRMAMGPGNTGSSGTINAPLTDDPKSTLALTGGAPLLANIAMGAKVDDALAGYFGANNYNDFYNSLSDSDKQLVDGVHKQLTDIQSNTDLRNQAVQNVVNDFPNIAAQAAKARQASGEEFDSTTKGYMDQALSAAQSKLAAGGNLSSGAAAEAEARVGASQGMNKLAYMDNRGDNAYNQGVQGWQARYNETNALRSFQNTMTQGAAGQGFSAVQNMLGRTQQTNLTNAGFANQQNIQNQQNDNAMFGAIGGLAGTALGAAFGGPAGAAVGGKLGGMMGSPAQPMSTNQMSFAPNGTGFSGNPRLNLGY